MAVIAEFASAMRRVRESYASLVVLFDQDDPVLCDCDLGAIGSECAMPRIDS